MYVFFLHWEMFMISQLIILVEILIVTKNSKRLKLDLCVTLTVVAL